MIPGPAIRHGSARWIMHCLWLLLVTLALPAVEPQPPRCLIINSYHQTYGWTDKQTRGILDSLTQAGITTQQVSIEYLDAKRSPDLLYDESFVQLLEHKYRLDRIGCVVLTDDPALNFALRFRSRLFPTTPVVFSGVNNFTPDRLLGQTGITGVGETADAAGTLRLAMRLHPQARKLVVVHDQTVSARLLRSDIDVAWAAMGSPLEFSALTDLTFDELAGRLRQVDDRSIVLLLSFASDREQHLLEKLDEAEIVQTNCRAPAYGVNEGRLGHGVIGGMLLSGVEHGAIAGRMAAAILAGRHPAGIPVDLGNHSKPMFDHLQLAEHGLGADQLPEDSVIINRPRNVWEDYHELVIAAIAVGLLLTAIITALVVAIIARRRTASRLVASELRFREVIANQPIPVAIADRQGRMLLFNKSFSQHFGWTIEDIPTFDVWWMKAYPDPPYREQLQMHWRQAFAQADRDQAPTPPKEVRLSCKDGGARLAEVMTRLYGDLVVATFQDITERNRSQEALREAAAQWQGTFDAVGEALWLLDADLRILRCNRAAEQLLLRIGGDAAAHPWTAEGRPDPSHDGCPVERARRSLRRETGEMRSGERIYEVVADPVLDAQGAFAGCVHLVGDITEVRRFEQELRHTEKLNAIGQLAGGVAHDFNNQLSGILGYSELILARVEDPSLRRYADGIRTSALRSADLTRKLLAFARKGQFVKATVDMHAVITETIGILTHSIDRRITIVREDLAGTALVLGDPSQLQNALLNLGLNARDAMPDGGTLTFATSIGEAEAQPGTTAGRHLIIRISDTGKGMTDEVKAHLFEPFFTTKGPERGTGMGLAAVYGTIRNHDGAVAVESALGLGSTIRLILPLAPAAGQPVGLRSEPAPAQGESLRVLVVDDEAGLRAMVRDLLTGDGHQVMEAADGRAAVELFRDSWRNIDVVLLDLMMPVMDGHDCFQAMRLIDPQARIILCSGFSADSRVQTLLAAGACGFLGKPFPLAELRARLAQVRSV